MVINVLIVIVIDLLTFSYWNFVDIELLCCLKMSSYKSMKLYEDLKVLFHKENEIVRKILFSSFFSMYDIEILKNELVKHGFNFSEEFCACMKAGRQYFIAEKLLDMFAILKEELEEEFEDPKCCVTTTSELSESKKAELEQILTQKHGKLRFSYEVSKDIVAGIVFKIGNCYYDGSFRQILSDIKMKVQKEMI